MRRESIDPGSFNTFGALLKQLRRRAQLTQAELSLAVGYSETYITRLEGDSRLPDPAVIRARFIDALHLHDEPHLAQQLITLAEAAHKRVHTGFDAPTSEQDVPRTSLPAQLTSFVGRTHDLAEVTRLLGEGRLVTLTGSGGVGKTRLAIESGSAARDQFAGGVWFIPLAPVVEPTLVSRAVADTFGLSEQPDRSLLDTASAYIGERRILLILDNCEHLIHICAEIVEALLRACPRLHILATSREWLNVPGETAWRVPSLAISETLQLFLDRAHAAQPSFAVTSQNTSAVASICAQLDGIPLAVELAAARLSSMSAEQLAARLSDRFKLLTGGSRTSLPRQQTLRATIDWSYELLSEHERHLLRWLSIFADGWTVDSAERVCACPEGCDILSLLLNLVDKSLVIVDDHAGETRYRMLEMIRQYAWEHLTACGEAETAHRRHAQYYLAFVQEHAPPLLRKTTVPEQFGIIGGSQPWFQSLDQERANLRSALTWSLSEARDPVDAQTGIYLALWLSNYWDIRGPRPEGRAWMIQALARIDPAARTQIRSRLLAALAGFLQFMGEDDKGESCAREALAISRELGNRYDTMTALKRLSEQACVSMAEERGLIEEWLSIAHDMGDARNAGIALWYLGLNLQHAGDFTRAADLFNESLRALPAQEQGAIYIAKYYQGVLMCQQFGGENGLTQIEEALAHFRHSGFQLGIITILLWLGDRALSLNGEPQARLYLNECLRVAYRDGAWRMFVSCLGSLGVVEAMSNQPARAVLMMAAAQQLNAAALSADQHERIAAARRQIDTPSLASIETAGRTMNFEQIMAYALGE